MQKMVRRVISKKQPSLQKPKTRYWKKMQGDLTNLQMLRLLNSFVVLHRCPDAERLVLMNRPTHRGRRNSVAVGNQVNENEPVIDADVVVDIDPEQVPEPEPQPQPQPQQIRLRSFSVYDVPRDRAPLDHNLDEFRAKIAPIDEQDEDQMDDVQENAAELDESQVQETQMEESHIEEGQSEIIQIQDIEPPQLPTSDEEITSNDCGSDSDIGTPEFNNPTQLQYFEDESFVSNAPVDDMHQSDVESLLVAEQQLIANGIDEPNDTSTTQDDAETTIGIDENVNVVGNLEDSGLGNSITESGPLKISTSDTGISSDVDVLTTDETDTSDLEVTEADATVDLTMDDSENSVSDKDDAVSLDLSRKVVLDDLSEKSDSIDLTASPNKAVPMETDHTEAAQNEDNVDDSHQGQAEPIEDQHPADDKSVCDSTVSEETNFNVSSDSSNLEVPSTNSTPNLENDVSSSNEIEQTTGKMASTDDETSDEDNNDTLNLSHTGVSQQETEFGSTMPMDIDRIVDTQYEENTLNGHEDMLQDEAVDHLNEAVPINNSQLDQGTALNLSQKLAVASVLTSDNNHNVGPVEKPMLQIKKEKEVVVNKDGHAEHKENVAH